MPTWGLPLCHLGWLTRFASPSGFSQDGSEVKLSLKTRAQVNGLAIAYGKDRHSFRMLLCEVLFGQIERLAECGCFLFVFHFRADPSIRLGCEGAVECVDVEQSVLLVREKGLPLPRQGLALSLRAHTKP